MRDSNAESMLSTRLEVRNKKPSKYSRMRRKIETSLLRPRSSSQRLAFNVEEESRYIHTD